MIQCDSCNESLHKSCKQIDDKYFDIPDILIIVLINVDLACKIVLFFVIVMPIILFVLYLLIVTNKDLKTNFLSIPCLINTNKHVTNNTPCHK